MTTAPHPASPEPLEPLEPLGPLGPRQPHRSRPGVGREPRIPRASRDRSGHPTLPLPGPLYLPASTHAYLDRSAASLQEAITTAEVPARYALAHVAALRATAALLAARARPTPRRGRQRSAWVLLAEVAPEFAEWARFFAAGAGKRAAAEAGSRRAVTEREADDLVRDADHFLALVETSLGLTRHVPVQVA